MNKKSGRKIIMTLLLILMIGAAVLAVNSLLMGGDNVHGEVSTQGETKAATESQTPVSEAPSEVTSSSVRFMCAGDNLIHSGIYKQAAQRANGNGYDFTFAYEQIEDILSQADFAVLNQETVLDPDHEPSNYPLFNSPQEVGEHMLSLGFNVINHANNHVLDKGVSGAMNTISFWKSKGVVLTGLYSDENDMLEVKSNTVNGITFSHVGFTEYLNGLSVPQASSLKVVSPVGANMTQDEFHSTMKKMIEQSKAKSDFVCVSMHFQQENITEPSASQRELVAKLVEYGADIIIGTGPHVLQPMEFVEREDGSRVLVMWSLGNFISAQARGDNMIGGIADITVEKKSDGTKSIVSAGLIPTVTHYDSGYSNLHLVPFDDYTPALASSHGVRAKSSYFSYDYIDEFLQEVIGEEFMLIKENQHG